MVFGSLLQGAMRIGGRAIRNSGSILNVYNSVRQAVGVRPTEEELNAFAAGDNILPQLIDGFASAAESLKQKAAEAAPAPPYKPGYYIMGPFDLDGFWPSPPAGNDTTATPVVSGDVNKFLMVNRLPDTGFIDGSDRSIGEELAYKMFPKPPKETGEVQRVPIKLSVERGNRIFNFIGLFFYFTIPLGDPGGYAGWQSHLRLWLQAEAPGIDELFAEQQSYAVVPQDQLELADGEPYSSSTCVVTWNGVRNTRQIMKRAVDSLLQKNPKLIGMVEPSIAAGPMFAYQFKTRTTLGPSEVESLVTTAIQNALPAAPKDAPALPRLPQVKATAFRTYVSAPPPKAAANGAA